VASVSSVVPAGEAGWDFIDAADPGPSTGVPPDRYMGVGTTTTLPPTPVETAWPASVEPPFALDQGQDATNDWPRWLQMALWGAIGGILTVPLIWLAGKGFEAYYRDRNVGLDGLETMFRVVFGGIGAAIGLGLGIGILLGRIRAGGSPNLVTVVASTVATAAMFAAYDTFLIGSNETELLWKSIALGAAIGAAATFSLGGAAGGAAAFAILQSTHGTQANLFSVFENADMVTAGEAIRSVGLLTLVGAAIGLGAATPTGMLRWPSPRLRYAFTLTPFVAVALIAVGGAGAVFAGQVAGHDAPGAEFDAGASLFGGTTAGSDAATDYGEAPNDGVGYVSPDGSTGESNTYAGSSSFTPTTVRSSPTTAYRASNGASSSGALTGLQASDFSISYPNGWTVEKVDDVPKGTSYRDTTIKRDLTDPHYVVRVDVMRGKDYRTAADEAVAALQPRPSFSLISRRDAVITTGTGSVQAVYVEFLLDHPDTGARLHTVDVFFGDGSGRTFAVLTRAPDSSFASWEDVFASVRESIQPR
jgi:hypothetical protein